MRALVTGGAKRLGREMALYLAKRGYDVAVHYNTSSSEADDVVSEIRCLGNGAVGIKADLLDEGQVKDLVPEANKQLGGTLGVLVNNASIFEYDNIYSATRESWDRHVESNLRAPFVLTQHFADQAAAIQHDKNGEPFAVASIVNIIDQRVRKLTPEFSSYSIAKMALWTVTQISAQGLAPKVRVNAIGPGPTLRGSRQTEQHFNKQRLSTILERGANASDILAALGYFLDSPAVTGQLLCIDGGQHLCWQTPDVLGIE